MNMLLRPLREPHSMSRGGGEAGSASVTGVMIFPVALAIVFAIIQGSTWLIAGNVAQAAASAAYNTARLYQSTAQAGVAAGEDVAAGSILEGVTVSVQRTPTTVTVTVRGTAPTIVPLMNTNVERTVVGPVERWVD